VSTATLDEIAHNSLLSILVDHDQRRLVPHLHSFDLKAGAILQHAGDDVVHTWFPCGAALACFLVSADSGDAVEVAVVGSEGAVGGIVSNGAVPAFATAQVRTGGRFLRIKTAALEQAKIDSTSLRHWFARYSDCLLAQVFQTAACNARHTIEQRACKWLLATAERSGSNEVSMTQDDLAALLGVGRTFVNRTLRRLREAALLSTHRGKMVILDRTRMAHTACRCATTVENHFDEVLHGIY
jgi:CRP-like cAMP-binding protein